MRIESIQGALSLTYGAKVIDNPVCRAPLSDKTGEVR
jgi:hypothetical protein